MHLAVTCVWLKLADLELTGGYGTTDQLGRVSQWVTCHWYEKTSYFTKESDDWRWRAAGSSAPQISQLFLKSMGYPRQGLLMALVEINRNKQKQWGLLRPGLGPGTPSLLSPPIGQSKPYFFAVLCLPNEVKLVNLAKSSSAMYLATKSCFCQAEWCTSLTNVRGLHLHGW